MFQFAGNLRLQLWFHSPNVCAAFLCMTIFLTLGLFQCFFAKKQLYYKIISFVIFCIMLFQMILLTQTYSRGGYVAFFATLCILWYLSREKLFPSCIGIFGIMLFFTSNGAERVGSIVETVDGSIFNRFLLWFGGTGIIANNWVSGIFPEIPGNIYIKWYQPLWLNEKYNSLVSDYLSIAVIYGIFVFLVYFFALFLLVLLAIKLYHKTNAQLVLYLIGTVTAYSVAAVFSTFYSLWEVSWLFYLSLITIAIVVIFHIGFGKFKISKFDVVITSVASLIFCGVILLSGVWANYNLPYRYHEINKQRYDETYTIVTAFPKKVEPKANIIYLFDSEQEDLIDAIRNTVRPLLLRGFTVYSVGVDSGLEGLKQTENIIQYCNEHIKNSKDIFIIGQGSGGKHAMIAAAKDPMPKLRGIAALGAPISWPFREISPTDNIRSMKIPLLLVYGEKDDNNPASQTLLFKKNCDAHGIAVDYKIIKGVGTSFAPNREFVLKIVDTFFSEQHKKDSGNRLTSLEMQVFIKPGCSHCKAYDFILDKISHKYESKLAIIKHDITKVRERVLYVAYCNRYGVVENTLYTPAIFISNRFMSGEEAVNKTEKELTSIFSDDQYEKTMTPTANDIKMAEKAIIDKFEKLPLFAILIAGLIDGINPCVFSTLVFFMSILTVSRIKDRELLLVGAVYCLSCYISYFLMGLGLLSIFNVINQFQVLGALFNYAMIGLLVILAIISLKDACFYWKTSNAKMVSLRLPDNLKLRIHNLIHRFLHYRYILPGIFLIGFCVTLIETACSGQVYIPVISMISRKGSFSLESMLSLVLYNSMCIIPVVAVLLLTYYGTTTKTFIRWTKKDVVIGKLMMSVLFILLAVLLIYL